MYNQTVIVEINQEINPADHGSFLLECRTPLKILIRQSWTGAARCSFHAQILDHRELAKREQHRVQRAVGVQAVSRHLRECARVWGRVGEREEDAQKGKPAPHEGTEGDLPEGAVQWEGPRDRVPTALVMIVIDAGTIQTAQTLQQIKRLFCKVVKEQNGKGEWWPPPPPPQLTSSALSHHQLLFGLLGVISPLGRRAITSISLSLILDTPLMLLVHIWECVWREGKYGCMHKGETVRLSMSQ